MINFTYTARDLKGQLKEGLKQAENQHDVLTWLREEGLIPVKVAQLSNTKNKTKKKRRKKVKTIDLSALCWQLSTMVDGGLPVVTSIELISEDIENATLQDVLSNICKDLHQGEELSTSLAKYPNIFSKLFISMIMAGEAGGKLGLSLKRLGQFLDERDKLSRKIKGALAYPIFVLAFAVAIVAAIMIFIIPRFRSIFDQVGSQLPAFTQGFLSVYDAVAYNLPYIVPAVGIFTFFLVMYCKTEKGYERFCNFMLNMPLFGKVIRQAFITMFCKTMATLLSAGVTVIETLDILQGLSSNVIISDAIRKTREHITQGSSVSLAMAGSDFFPNMVIKMMQVGEESGSLPNVLERTSEYYERKVDSTVTMIMGLLEPALIVFVGMIVLVVVVALYLPVFSISDMQK